MKKNPKSIHLESIDQRVLPLLESKQISQKILRHVYAKHYSFELKQESEYNQKYYTHILKSEQPTST